jgi:hypothetical protein
VNIISEFKYKIVLHKSKVYEGLATVEFCILIFSVITEYMVKWNSVTNNVTKGTKYFASSLTSVFRIGNVFTSCLAYMNSHDNPAC